MLHAFWKTNPALLIGLTVFLGCLFALQTPWALFPFFCLLFSTPSVLKATLLFLAPLPLLYHFYTFPPSGTEITGTFHIHSLRKVERFGSGWLYRGVLKTKKGRVHCQSYLKQHLDTGYCYHVKGTLHTHNGRYFSLKTKERWEPLHKKWSLAEWRYRAKLSVTKYIHRHISQKRAANFIAGMVTGQLEDRVMLKEFGQLGLSHIMAISGFHFALLAFVLHLLFRLVLSSKIEAAALIFCLTLYLLFIGDSPSIVRAWTMAMVVLLGQLFERGSSPLNSLGVAISLSLIINPLSSTTLSFHLSFLATAGILFLFSPLHRLLLFWMPKYPLKEAVQKNLFWQIGYIALSFFREACALTLAVHIALIPLLLSLFHTFSFNSLLYNLFFPFLAALSLFLFICGVVFGSWLHTLNGYYSEWILRITESPPWTFKTIYVDSLPNWLSTTLLTALLLTAICLEIKKRGDRFGVADRPLFDHR